MNLARGARIQLLRICTGLADALSTVNMVAPALAMLILIQPCRPIQATLRYLDIGHLLARMMDSRHFSWPIKVRSRENSAWVPPKKDVIIAARW